MKTTDRFLLTGAGFTANFGGPLAKEVWSMVFNHRCIANARRVRALLRTNFDFEDVYHTVLHDDFSEEDREAIEEGVYDAYESIDAAIMEYNFGDGLPYPNCYMVQDLVAAFCGSSREPGFVFTLNQDLFLERHHYGSPRPRIPGIRGDAKWFSSNFNRSLSSDDLRTLPSSAELTQRPDLSSGGAFYYIKLHGSCNWRSSLHKTHMVIGRGKEERIQAEPLLSRYFDLFTQVISMQDARLLVIGYGFGDPHVNTVLAKAVQDSGLHLSVLTPENPASLSKRLRSLPHGSVIWGGLGGYYESTLAQMFPGDQSKTSKWKELSREFFRGVLRWPGAPAM